MRAMRFYVASLLALCVSGCFRPSIVGEWQGTKAIGPAVSQVAYSFGADKRYTSVNEIASSFGSLKTAQSGTYEIEGNRITLSQRSATVNGAAIQRAEVITETHQYQVSGDTLILNMERPDKIVLTRVRK